MQLDVLQYYLHEWLAIAILLGSTALHAHGMAPLPWVCNWINLEIEAAQISIGI